MVGRALALLLLLTPALAGCLGHDPPPAVDEAAVEPEPPGQLGQWYSLQFKTGPEGAFAAIPWQVPLDSDPRGGRAFIRVDPSRNDNRDDSVASWGIVALRNGTDGWEFVGGVVAGRAMADATAGNTSARTEPLTLPLGGGRAGGGLAIALPDTVTISYGALFTDIHPGDELLVVAGARTDGGTTWSLGLRTEEAPLDLSSQRGAVAGIPDGVTPDPLEPVALGAGFDAGLLYVRSVAGAATFQYQTPNLEYELLVPSQAQPLAERLAVRGGPERGWGVVVGRDTFLDVEAKSLTGHVYGSDVDLRGLSATLFGTTCPAPGACLLPVGFEFLVEGSGAGAIDLTEESTTLRAPYFVDRFAAFAWIGAPVEDLVPGPAVNRALVAGQPVDGTGGGA